MSNEKMMKQGSWRRWFFLLGILPILACGFLGGDEPEAAAPTPTPPITAETVVPPPTIIALPTATEAAASETAAPSTTVPTEPASPPVEAYSPLLGSYVLLPDPNTTIAPPPVWNQEDPDLLPYVRTVTDILNAGEFYLQHIRDHWAFCWLVAKFSFSCVST